MASQDSLCRPDPWHAELAAAAHAAFQTTPQGLSEAAAAERLERFGPNRLTPPKRRGPLLRLLLQFHSV